MKKLILLLPFVFSNLVFGGEDIIFEDFESGSYAPKWTVEGTAFAEAPKADGRYSNQQPVSGFNGKYLVNSYFGRDESVGKMTSVPFKIEHNYLKCLIGAGNNPQYLYLRVLVDDKEIGRLTGINNERLVPKAMNLSGYIGKKGVIEIVDNFTGGWGHINVDDIIFTDTTPDCELADTTYEIKKAKRYICLPIDNDIPRRRTRIMSSKGVLVDTPLALNFEKPKRIVYLNTREHFGEDLKITFAQKVGEKPKFTMADKFDAKDYPNEFLRPQYHISPPQGWMNDPNGMVYWQGMWRLYYQAIPYQVSDRGSDKSWALAVSKDLINWQHKPIAIYPQFNEDGSTNAIWSGNGFADTKNRSGLFDKNGGLLFAYTFTGKGDVVAYSKDGDFPKKLENPITLNRGRDPCIFYHEGKKHWVVLRYEEVDAPEHNDRRKFAFYVSKDLKTWQRTQLLDDFYECPYIVSMPVNGNKNDVRYLIFDARGECVVGDFDGEKFTRIGEKRCPKFVIGDAYAGQIFHNAPNGRIVNMSWLRQHIEDFLAVNLPFAEMMTLPMDLSLVKKGEDYLIYAKVSPEIEKYYLPATYSQKKEKVLAKSEEIEIKDLSSSYMFECDLDISNCNEVMFEIVNSLKLRFDKKNQCYRFNTPPKEERLERVKDLKRVGIHFDLNEKITDGKLRCKVFIDRSSIEVFHDEKQVMALYVPFTDAKQTLKLTGENLKINTFEVREIKPVFSKKNLPKAGYP